MVFSLLHENITAEELRSLSGAQLEQLCGEIRSFLIESVSKTGGHLSSNLGTVELSVALVRAFHFPTDVVLWDVGHQSYTYKLLTGRMGRFDTLRKAGGLSGFPNPAETPYDAFIAGHASNSLSAAIGIAAAKKLKGEEGYVIAVIGDGALAGGMIYEGLNNITPALDNLLIILNDNKMSISKSVGAMSRYLTTLRNNPAYSNTKKTVERILLRLPLIGRLVYKVLLYLKDHVRRLVYKSTFFEEMGLGYIGRTDGNDVTALAELFENIQSRPGPMLLHLETVKGKGYKPAEDNPGAFHGVSTFDYKMEDPDTAPADSFSTVFGHALNDLAQNDESICAITAAMKYGTGLQYFAHAHRARFFDVGMAEQHGVTFAAGLASRGLLPVYAVYSTFLQRGYDQLIHDVLLQKLNVLFAIDRAGLVPGDGETHQGIYDVAFLSDFAGFTVVSPCNYAELRAWLPRMLYEYSGPRAIRYPRGGEDSRLSALPCTGEQWDRLSVAPGAKRAIVTYGRLSAEVLTACELCGGAGVPVDGYKITVVHPLPDGLAQALLPYDTILFAEDGITEGGVGQRLGYELLHLGWQGSYALAGVSSPNVDHTTVQKLYENYGLDAKALAGEVMK